MSKSYLLDTHCLLWFQENNPKIPSRVMDIIQNPANTIYFSQISLFEISIKQKIGKLPLFLTEIKEVYHQAIKDDFIFLPVQNSHIFYYDKIPLLKKHRDPFDRLLIATASVENSIIITSDEMFHLYPKLVQVFW
jgi:PIN domain nuclease of toxin-antitoxin system